MGDVFDPASLVVTPNPLAGLDLTAEASSRFVEWPPTQIAVGHVGSLRTNRSSDDLDR